jgi:hypothetical protein
MQKRRKKTRRKRKKEVREENAKQLSGGIRVGV